MDRDVFRKMDAHGRSYWWYQGKQALIRYLAQQTGVTPGGRVLDLGCGTGTLFEFLEGWGDVVGLELSRDALILAKARSDVPLVRATTEAIPFRDGSFSLVAVFDCLEHLNDDLHALAQVRRLLSPDGALVISVPAFRFLASWRDMQLQHMRRYTKSGLRFCIETAGFRVESMVYGYLCLFFPLLLKSIKDRLSSPPAAFKSDINDLKEPWNGMLARWLKMEAWVAAHAWLPFGTSIFAVARPVREESMP